MNAEAIESRPLPGPDTVFGGLLRRLKGVRDALAPGEWSCDCPSGCGATAIVWEEADARIGWDCKSGCSEAEIARALGPPPQGEPKWQAQRPEPRRITLADVEAPPIESFIVGSLFALSKASVVYGPSGAGKSAFLAQLAFKVAAGGGGSFLGMHMHDQVGGPVLVYSAEDTFDDWVRKAAAVRQGYPDIDVARAIERLAVIDKSEGEARLTEIVQMRVDLGAGSSVTRHGRKPTEERLWLIDQAKKLGARLVIIETASRLVEDESNENMAALLSACGDVAAQTQSAVVISHHPTKAASADNDSRAESARGGGAFISNSRGAVSLFPADAKALAILKEQRGLEFADGDVLELAHQKGTSSVRKQKPILLARCSTPFGAVLQLPELLAQDPHQAAELAHRAARQNEDKAANFAALYDKVEELKRVGPVSKNKLRPHRAAFGVTASKKEIVDAFVDSAVLAGVLKVAKSDASGRVLDMDLGVRPGPAEETRHTYSRDRFREAE